TEPSLDLASLIRKVATAISHDARTLDFGCDLVAKVTKHHLHVVPRLTKDDRGHPRTYEIRGEHHRLFDVARTDPELGVHDRGVIEKDPAFTLRRTVVRDRVERRVVGQREHARGVFVWITDGRRGADEHRVRSVKAGDAE